MFQQQAKKELVETIKAFYAYKQEEGQSIDSYQLMKKAYLDQMGKTIPEPHAMLKLAEKGIPKKALAFLAIRQGHRVSSLSQDWTLEEKLSFLFGRVKEEQSQHVWHIKYLHYRTLLIS
ncbi:hypothetical protein Tco_0283840 [Tanacetum coccineum]